MGILSDLISKETKNQTDLENQLSLVAGARAELAEVSADLHTLQEIADLRDGMSSQAKRMVKGAQDAVSPLQSSTTYLDTQAAIALGLKGKSDADMAGAIAGPLPVLGDTYASYVAKVSDADATLATRITEEATARIALVAMRSTIDVRIASLTAYATGVEARLSQARAFLTSAARAAQANRVAAAWWAFHHIQPLLDYVKAATVATLSSAVDAACDEYATAYNTWLGARKNLAEALADRASAADKLAQAEAAALAILVAV